MDKAFLSSRFEIGVEAIAKLVLRIVNIGYSNNAHVYEHAAKPQGL
jgi:hypothetical protein